MFCSQCGAILGADDKFCAKCGAAVQSIDPLSTAQANVPHVGGGSRKTFIDPKLGDGPVFEPPPTRAAKKQGTDVPISPAFDTPASSTIGKSNSWDWIWVIALIAIIMKLFGAAPGLATIGAYYWLKPRLGIWGAVAASGVIGVVVAVGLSVMLRI